MTQTPLYPTSFMKTHVPMYQNAEVSSFYIGKQDTPRIVIVGVKSVNQWGFKNWSVWPITTLETIYSNISIARNENLEIR